MITLDQFRIFIKVAETLNMTRAAEALNLTQPAVSAAISVIEQRYGIQLFDRVGRRLQLTIAGRLLLPSAEAVLVQANEACSVLDDLAGLNRGEVRIASSQTVATAWLPRRMARFASRHPNIALSLSVGNTEQAVAAVHDGLADIGVVEGEIEGHAGAGALQTKTVGADTLGLYVAPGHPFADRAIGKRELTGSLWVMREAGSGTRTHVARALAARGLSLDDLRVGLTLPSNGAVLEAASASEMIAPVSDLAAGARLAAGLVKRLAFEFPERKFTTIRHKARYANRAARAFLETLEDRGAVL
ncbi:LysR family transcriptional regulator [Sphingosinicella microcystinivorans]|uniref:LysR family transcriptional regulator n=1 Tax=Sphingosinicella microcystinivorans TaxID=335406 RepID=UPI0022F3A831|nr:LysR family transcriptional regulator [Sphingosinicella microcystinivorans]WBX86181.1 LysR family transcriptional regulator [Sphingosinicella microcystinivorans]